MRAGSFFSVAVSAGRHVNSLTAGMSRAASFAQSKPSRPGRGWLAVANMGSPKGRESYGDGVPVVVGGVETANDGSQGEGAQAMNE